MLIPNFKSEKFAIAPAGIDVFMIDSVSYDPEKNAVKVTFRMRDADRKHTETYRLDVDFQVKALGNMLRSAYNDDSLEDINGDIIEGAIGRQTYGKIVHREWQDNKYASIDAFSYKPVDALHTYVKTISDVINDEEPVA